MTDEWCFHCYEHHSININPNDIATIVSYSTDFGNFFQKQVMQVSLVKIPGNFITFES